jgi:hypothetical protein
MYAGMGANACQEQAVLRAVLAFRAESKNVAERDYHNNQIANDPRTPSA